MDASIETGHLYAPPGKNYYQVYPRSFKEVRPPGETYRGQGTILGIIDRLDYLATLGIDDIWVSPCFPSPGKDGGYDISEYNDIDPTLGSLPDVEQLTFQAHERDMSVTLDFVLNHTSNEHPWFVASRDPSHPDHHTYRDYYIWRDPHPTSAPGEPLPPNNWPRVFSKSQIRARMQADLEGVPLVAPGELTPPLSAWSFDECRGQFYLASFSDVQPNLNSHNPIVREEWKRIMRFWLDMGIDGFRIDAVPYIGTDPELVDEARNPLYAEDAQGRPLPPYDNPYDQYERYHSCEFPDTFYPYIREISSVLDEEKYRPRDLRIIYEAYMSDTNLRRIVEETPPHSTPFNFTSIDAPWNAAIRKRIIDQYHAQRHPHETPNHVLTNHDKTYPVTRFGRRSARAAAVWNLTQSGSVFVYNGEEAGFEDTWVPPERIQDPLGMRDGVRAPMCWDATINAGFSRANPADLWLPQSPQNMENNIAAQMRDPDSFYWLYRTLLHLRKTYPPLREGQYIPLETNSEDVVAFGRRTASEQCITIVNMSHREQRAIRIDGAQQHLGAVLLSSLPMHNANRTVDLHNLILEPQQGLLIGPNTQAAIAFVKHITKDATPTRY